MGAGRNRPDGRRGRGGGVPTVTDRLLYGVQQQATYRTRALAIRRDSARSHAPDPSAPRQSLAQPWPAEFRDDAVLRVAAKRPYNERGRGARTACTVVILPTLTLGAVVGPIQF